MDLDKDTASVCSSIDTEGLINSSDDEDLPIKLSSPYNKKSNLSIPLELPPSDFISNRSHNPMLSITDR